MKVLFLDVDGVLNTDKDVYKYGSTYINPRSVDFLKFIVLSTNASIVLSSSWRLWEEAKKMVEQSLYLKRLHILDSTPQIIERLSGWTPRSKEISSWLSNRPQVKKFAILDDNSDAGEGFQDSFFQTDSEIGLTIEIAELIVNHLNDWGK